MILVLNPAEELELILLFLFQGLLLLLFDFRSFVDFLLLYLLLSFFYLIHYASFAKVGAQLNLGPLLF